MIGSDVPWRRWFAKPAFVGVSGTRTGTADLYVCCHFANNVDGVCVGPGFRMFFRCFASFYLGSVKLRYLGSAKLRAHWLFEFV